MRHPIDSFDSIKSARNELSNGMIVYTDPNTEYSDKDTLTDDEELGIRKSLKNARIYSRLTLSGIDGLDYWDYISNPTLDNSDTDCFIDNEDAIPRVENDEIIYIFAIDDFWEDARLRQQIYLDSKCKRTVLMKISGEDFYDKWNVIGEACSVSGTIYDCLPHKDLSFSDKYFFNVKAVVIITHGSLDNAICIGNNMWLYSNDHIKKSIFDYSVMNMKKMDMLCLYSCFSAKPNNNGKLNMAQYFLEYFPLIKEVVGFDIQLRISSSNSYFGLWYDNDPKCMEEHEYRSFLTNYYSGPHADSSCVLFSTAYLSAYLIDYEAQGFICYYQDGTKQDLFDDVREGKLHYYVKETNTTGSVIYTKDGFDYTVQRDPLLILYG